MKQDITLRALQIIDRDGVGGGRELTAQALAEYLGDDWNSVAALQQALVSVTTSSLTRELKRAALDPDQIIEAEQMSIFPVAHHIVSVDESGNEVFKSGRDATVAEHEAHVTRVARRQKATWRKIEEARNKIVAVKAATVDAGDDPMTLNYVDAIEKHGGLAIGMIRGEVGQV